MAAAASTAEERPAQRTTPLLLLLLRSGRLSFPRGSLLRRSLAAPPSTVIEIPPTEAAEEHALPRLRAGGPRRGMTSVKHAPSPSPADARASGAQASPAGLGDLTAHSEADAGALVPPVGGGIHLAARAPAGRGGEGGRGGRK